jgi:hypothetical protein
MNAGRFIPNLVCAMKISEDDTSLGLPPAFLHVACEKMGGPWWTLALISQKDGRMAQHVYWYT